MFVTRISNVLAVLLAFGGIGTAVGLSARPAALAQEKQAPAGPDGARKRLRDPDPQVRFKAAVDLSGQLDEEAINVLIELLAVLPAAQRRQAELALQGVAEEFSPNPALAGDDEISRRILRDAWAGWWRNTDGPALLAAFHKRTLTPDQAAKAYSRIAALDDEAFATRQRAAGEVVAMGLPVVPLLRQALPGASLEQSRRIEQCLRQIAKAHDGKALPVVAARLLALRKPAGAIETLLAYVPFTDDDVMRAEVTNALHHLARVFPSPKGERDRGEGDSILVKALRDAFPVRRAIAGDVLVAVTDAEVRAAVRKLLADPDLSVRLRVAVALACAADREAVPVLIDLLADLPRGELWQAEEILCRIAGAAAPQMEPAEDAAGRTKYRDAWRTWWKDNAAATKLAVQPVPPPLLGFTVIAAIADANPANSRILELDRSGKVRWQFDGVNYPGDAHVLPGNRVLIAEMGGLRITERDFRGNILWQKNDLPAPPSNVQRLANGNTFVCTHAGLIEFDAAGKTVLNIKVDTPQAAYKTVDGQIIYLTGGGACIRLDAAGKEVNRFVTGQGGDWLDLTPRGRILVDHLRQVGVGEFDLEGKRLWQAPVTVGSTPVRNGHVISGNWSTSYVTEVDRAGKVLWQYQLPAGYKPWRARKR
jgi:HEAT repeat protein